MAAPYDSVISIGGQSLVNGVWRIFGPALEGLTNPLPVAIPGFSNAQLRITDIIPVIPGNPPATGGLAVVALVDLVAEALLTVTTSMGTLNVSLPFTIDSLTGTIGLPPESGTVTNLKFVGGAANLGTGSGAVDLPGGAAPLQNVLGSGTIPLGGLAGLPAVVPIPVNLTPDSPLSVSATVTLTVDGPSASTLFGLRFGVSQVKVSPIPAIGAAGITAATMSLNQSIAQLAGLIPGVTSGTIDDAVVGSLLSNVPKPVGDAVGEALSRLIGETGRLLFPNAQAGSSCEAEMLATGGDARLVVGTAGDYVLQLGAKRATSTDIGAFPTFTPSGLGDCGLLVGNRFLLELISCIVERLPAFGIAGGPASPDANDVRGDPHSICFNFFKVTADFTPIPIGSGALSVCLDGGDDKKKTVSLVGEFNDTIEVDNFPDVGSIHVDFKVPLDFDVDNLASIANLRPFGNAEAHAGVSISKTFELVVIGLAFLVAGTVGAIIGAAAGGILGWLGSAIGGLIGGVVIGASVGIIAAVVLVLALEVGAIIVGYVLKRAVGTLLGGASLLPSPVALPPGILDAFGKLASNFEVLDDLISEGVLHTPTSPWAVLPKLGPRGRPPRPPKPQPPRGRGENQPRPRKGAAGRGAAGATRPRTGRSVTG